MKIAIDYFNSNRDYLIYSAESGTINWTGSDKSGSNMITIKSDSYDPYTEKPIYFNYMHMADPGGLKGAGSRVSKGEIIGYVGDTTFDGSSVGFHLHFEVYATNNLGKVYGASRYPGETIDPREFYSNI